MGRDGRQLAVKVQHAGLRESGAADTATIGLAVALLRYFAPDYDYRWVVDETRTSLPLVRMNPTHNLPLAPERWWTRRGPACRWCA